MIARYADLRRPPDVFCSLTGLRVAEFDARPPDDIACNRAFARRRVIVEHTIGQMRLSQALSQLDRYHRQHHTARARAAAGQAIRTAAGTSAWPDSGPGDYSSKRRSPRASSRVVH